MDSPIDRHRRTGAILSAVLLPALLMVAGCSDEVTGADPPATHPLVVYEPPDAGGWIPQNGTFHAMHDIWGAGPDDVLAVGDHGSILRLDGGTSLDPQAMLPGIHWRGVWGTAADSIWVIGSTTASQCCPHSGDVGVIHRSDGDGWRQVAGVTGVVFQGIWGSSSRDIYAVGHSNPRMVVLHDDGRGWQEVSDPLITGSFRGTAVWGSSPDDVFVAGWDGIAYVLHYDGEAWRRQETPGAWITALWGTGPDDVYATDEAGQILRHDGTGWSIVASFDEPLHDIHGFGGGEVFACGKGRIVARHGDQWIEMPIDTPRWASSTRHDEQYTALWGPDPERLYCTGHVHDANVNATSAFTLVLDGGRWRFLEPPASAAIQDMWGVSDDEVYAVGRLSGVLRFDGSVWRPVPMTGLDTWPATDGSGEEFLCVWASGPDEIICGTRRSLWRFDGTSWSETAPFRGAADLWGMAADDLYAIEHRYADGPGPFLVMHHDGSAWEEIGAIERKPYKLHGLASGAIVAVGYGGSVWYHDGGVWMDIGPIGGHNFAIWGDELDGLLVGGHERDEIFRHADGAWQTVDIPASLFTAWSILGDADDLHLLSDRDDDVLRFDGVDWYHTRHVTVRARGGWTGEATLFAGGPHGRIFHRDRAAGSGRPATE